jgi:hypothetical protein
VTLAPTFAATKPGKEVPAPSSSIEESRNRDLCCQTYSARITLQGQTNNPYSSFKFYTYTQITNKRWKKQNAKEESSIRNRHCLPVRA